MAGKKRVGTVVIDDNEHGPLTKGQVLERPGASRTGSQSASTEMGRQVAGVLYALAMVAVIVGVDLAFVRNRLWERLMVNVGIVLVFAAFYLKFFRRS